MVWMATVACGTTRLVLREHQERAPRPGYLPVDMVRGRAIAFGAGWSLLRSAPTPVKLDPGRAGGLSLGWLVHGERGNESAFGAPTTGLIGGQTTHLSLPRWCGRVGKVHHAALAICS
jgi:hypothetical protein